MVLKILAILALIACGLSSSLRKLELDWQPAQPQLVSQGRSVCSRRWARRWSRSCLLSAVGRPRALSPARSVSREESAARANHRSYRRRRTLSRGEFRLSARAGSCGLAATTTPASDVMRLAFGPTGARAIAAGIAISTLGFLSQGMLTAPRVYFAMAKDGLFFKSVGNCIRRTQVPIMAIALQGVLAMIIARTGELRYRF